MASGWNLLLFAIGTVLVVGVTYLVLGYIGDTISSVEKTVCSRDQYNCAYFATQEEAQKVFIECGGANNDVHNLDENSTGIACASLA